jgi:hypothetical protein
VAAPLATYTGWNPRHASIGGVEMNLLLNGATIPFARTSREANAAGDQRRSIAERYASSDDYLERVRQAALESVAARHLLESDVEAVVNRAADKYAVLSALDAILPN